MKSSEQYHDVIIAGGGLSGFAAARACALAGLDTLIVERRPLLGWESAWALNLDLHGGTSDAARVLSSRMESAGGLKDGRLDAPILEMILDREATSCNLKVLLYSQCIAPLIDEQGMGGVIAAGKSGEMALRSRAFVDATENGLLWQRAGGSIHLTQGPARFALFINGVGAMGLPLSMGSTAGVEYLVLKPGVWPGEVAVEFVIPSSDVRAARRMLPQVLGYLREAVPQFGDSLVTNVAVEPFPLTCGRSYFEEDNQHRDIANLFAAGSWAAEDAAAMRTVAGRLDFGEAAGKTVAQRFPHLPERSTWPDSSPSLSAPPLHETEVLVVGGGTAGALAGIAAAREGARTTLLEACTFLGGIGSGGGIHSYYHGIPGGLQDEVDARMRETTPLFGPVNKAPGFHPETKKVVLQQMAEEAGVKLVFDTTVTGVEVEDLPTDLPSKGTGRRASRRIRGVVTAGPEGGAAYRAAVVIDSSGDADVAFMAGAPFTYGRETDSLPHAYSQAAGVLDGEGRLRIVNFDAGYCDPTDVEDLTRARRLGLKHFERDHYAEEHRLVYIAPLIGLRSSRHIVGDYRLTLADEIVSREFPDVIAYAKSHYDNHALDYANESDEAMLWVWLLGHWRTPIGCEIPYRCLLPQSVEGLLVACRALSVTHDAHNQLRMQRDMQRLGEAAGIAAALSIRQKVTPRQLPLEELQQKLLQTGALGQRKAPELTAGELPAIHAPEALPAALPLLPVDQLAQELENDNPRAAVWPLCRYGEDAIPALRNALASDKPDTRFWASVGLAMLNQPESASALIERVRARENDRTDSLRIAPTWYGAMVLLGRLGDRNAVPAISDVLQDSSVELDALIAAVRALGRIGDPAGIAAVEKLMERGDLPVTRTLSSGPVNRVVEDARWQIDLAAAEALARMGTARPDLVEPYVEDERAYVRRYANRILEERLLRHRVGAGVCCT